MGSIVSYPGYLGKEEIKTLQVLKSLGEEGTMEAVG